MARFLKRLESAKGRLFTSLLVPVALPIIAVFVFIVASSIGNTDFRPVLDVMILALYLLMVVIIAPKYLVLWVASLFATRYPQAAARSFIAALGPLAVYDLFVMAEDSFHDYSYSEPTSNVVGITGIVGRQSPSFLESYGWIVAPALSILLFMTLYFILTRNSKKRT